MKAKRLSIGAAREFGRALGLDQVIVASWSKAKGRTTVTTWGRDKEQCAQAAAGGNLVKKALGWPDEYCEDEPARVRKMRQEIRDLRRKIVARDQADDPARIADAIVDRLFTDGSGNRADRLVHRDDTRERYGGGWCPAAVRDQILEALRVCEFPQEVSS